MMNNLVNCANSTTTGVILGATSTMPIGEAGENGGISGILNSAMLNKQLMAQEDSHHNGHGMLVHDHLKSASMLKGQFYQDLMEDDVGGYCGAFEDG